MRQASDIDAHAAAAFPLIRAVLQGLQPGTVFASDASAIVITRFGFMQQLGGGDVALYRKFEYALCEIDAELPRYLLWYDTPLYWQNRLADMGIPARHRTRVRWKLHRLLSSPTVLPLPPSLRIERLNAEWLARCQPLGLDLGARFWHNAQDLLAHGLGMCIVDDQHRVHALAYSACVVDGIAEIDIAVAPESRGVSLGHHVGHAFVALCLANGILPTWDCFGGNQPSMRLAASLGFEPAHSYPLYSFEITAEVRRPITEIEVQQEIRHAPR